MMLIWRKILSLRNIVTVEPYMFMFIFCISIQYISEQQLLFYKVCIQFYNDSILCKEIQRNHSAHSDMETSVNLQTNEWLFYQSVIYTLPSIFTSLFYGAWADRYSHKLVLTLPLIGGILSTINYFICSIYIELHPAWLCVSSILTGIFGGFTAGLTGGYSYISNISDVHSRTRRMAILESMIILGLTYSSFLSGIIIDYLGWEHVFTISGGVFIILFFYTIFWIEEITIPTSLSITGHRSRLSFLFDPSFFKSCFQTLFKFRPHRRRLYILSVLLAFFLFTTTSLGKQDTIMLFIKATLDWTAMDFGIYTAVCNFSSSICLLALLPLLKICFDAEDTTIGSIGIISKFSAMLMLSFATTTWMVFTSAGIEMLNGFTSTCCRSMLSRLVSTRELGKMLAISSSVEMLAILFASTVYNMALWPIFLPIRPGLIFNVSCGLLLMCLIIFICLHFQFQSHPIALHQVRDDNVVENLVDDSNLDDTCGILPTDDDDTVDTSYNNNSNTYVDNNHDHQVSNSIV